MCVRIYFSIINDFNLYEIILNRLSCYLFQIYTWFVIYPVSWIITASVAILTVLFSFLINARWASKWIAPWWGKLIIFISFTKVEIIGGEHFDKSQSYVVVCNHQSTYDTMMVYGYFPGEFKWVMKKELKKVPFVGAAGKAMKHIFIDRRNSAVAKQSLIDAKEIINGGVSAFFFPEGTRSPSGELLTFKKGAFRMAKSLGLPILPITISGANKVMPAKSLVICPGRITLTIGDPISSVVVRNSSVNELSKLAKQRIAAYISHK